MGPIRTPPPCGILYILCLFQYLSQELDYSLYPSVGYPPLFLPYSPVRYLGVRVPALLSIPSLQISTFANSLPSFQTMNRRARHPRSVAMDRYITPSQVMFPWSLAYKAFQTEVVRYGLKIVISALTRSNDIASWSSWIYSQS